MFTILAHTMKHEFESRQGIAADVLQQVSQMPDAAINETMAVITAIEPDQTKLLVSMPESFTNTSTAMGPIHEI